MKIWAITFYRWMLWWMKYGLTIATSTGRNPADIKQRRLDIASISKFIDTLEIQQ